MIREEVGRAVADGAALGSAFHASIIGMAVVDNDGRFRAVNASLAAMLGREPHQLLGRPTTDFTHPDDRVLSVSTIDAVRSGRTETEQIRKRFIRPDGTVVHVVRTVTALHDELGAAGMLTQMIDVTNVADAEEALRRSERRLGAVLWHASELTVLIDRSAVITFASPASLRLLGYDPQSVVGLAALDFVHPDDAEDAARELTGRLTGGATAESPSVYRIRHRDGTWWTAEVHIDDLFDDPDIGALLLHLRDVTEQNAYRDQVAVGEQRLRSLVGNSWDVITLHGADGRYLYVSPAVTAQLGWDPEELIGTEPWRLIHPDDSEAQLAFFRSVARTSDGHVVQYRARHRDGSWRWVESIASNRIDDPAVGGIIVTTRDVTARRRRGAQQQAMTELSGLAVHGEPLDVLFDAAVATIGEALEVSSCAVLRESPDGCFEAVSSHGSPLSGVGSHRGVQDGRPVTMEVRARAAGGPVLWQDSGEDSPYGLGRLADGGELRSGVGTVIGSGEHHFGALVCYSDMADAFSSEDLSFVAAMANVLAAAIEGHRIEQELRRQASSDDLTRLPNRSALLGRLDYALSQRRSVALLLIDVDDFKLVNDSLGHATGDQVVQSVASRLASSLRQDDTVARFGGDEFVVLCEGASATEAAAVAERIREMLATPLGLGGRQLSLTASIGYAVGTPGCSSDDLLAQADTAMYAAKQAGKNRVVRFDEEMRRSVTERLEVASGLRRAIDCDELRLHYQPVVDVATGSVIGAEALLRWQHPRDGLLLPGRFIGYAEDSGLILPVGEWVMEQAMRQAAAWVTEGFTGRVAINVSARQLADTDLVASVCAALERTGADTSNLALEVTESAVMTDVARSAAVLGQLRALGLQIGMDDFGTGHSSLSYLATLPFDFVKIDRSFVSRFDQERRAAALLETIATLCRSLELPAIAEGVETAEQLAEVRRLGIAQAQGYLLGRPGPADVFPRPGASLPHETDPA
jgi:diguanylate cyclase (GGDEF)-like protein/PAS domain S-box-containing protein